MIKIFLLFFLISTTAPAAETLATYWPINSSKQGWNLIDVNDKTSSSPKVLMTVANSNVNANEFYLWFFNRPDKPVGTKDIEHYRYCTNQNGNAWLFLDEYIKVLGP